MKTTVSRLVSDSLSFQAALVVTLMISIYLKMSPVAIKRRHNFIDTLATDQSV